MASAAETAKIIRDLSKSAGVTDEDLVAACREIVTEADKPTTQGMLNTLKAFGDAQEDPRERLKRNMQSGKLPD